MAQDILDYYCPYYLSITKDKSGQMFCYKKTYNKAYYDYDPTVYDEWHHITPICMFGSLEDLRKPEFSIEYVASPSTNHDIGWC